MASHASLFPLEAVIMIPCGFSLDPQPVAFEV